jgi:hypothetical protein
MSMTSVVFSSSRWNPFVRFEAMRVTATMKVRKWILNAPLIAQPPTRVRTS